MDLIFIEELRLKTRVGLYPREKAVPQSIALDLQIGLSTAAAGVSDDIHDTIDYARVAKRLRAELGERHFNLLEGLAEFVASLILQEFPAQWVRVSVAKLGIMSDVKRVGIVIQRQKTGSE
jgi:dihydroneopterin aldolase